MRAPLSAASTLPFVLALFAAACGSSDAAPADEGPCVFDAESSLTCEGGKIYTCPSGREPAATCRPVGRGTSYCCTGGAPAVGALEMSPGTMYSGTDGTHTFRVPFAVYNGGDDLEVTVADPSVADIAPAKLTAAQSDEGAYYILTVKKAGTTEIVAKSGALTTSGSLTVAEYGPALYAAGAQRYTTGSGGQPACTQCHSEGGIDHSPAALSGATDGKVRAIVRTGIGTNGQPIRTTDNHKWSVTDAELDGLVAYLRALPPKGFE